MFTIVKDKEYIAFTLVSEPSSIYPLVRRFEELAPEWGISNSGRIALVLRELLSDAVMRGKPQDGSRRVRCWVERTSEGPFKITVENEGGGLGFGFFNTSAPDALQNERGDGYALVRKVCRNLNLNARRNRVTALVDATETIGEEQ